MDNINPQGAEDYRSSISPAEKQLDIGIRQMALSLGIVAITIAVLTLLSFLIIWAKNNQVKSLEATISTKNQEIETNYKTTLKKQENLGQQINQFKASQSGQAIDLSGQLMAELSKSAIKNIQITSLSYEDKKVAIEGRSDSFTTIARQIASWRQSKYFTGLAVESVAKNETGDRIFSANFNFSPHK